MTKDHSLLPVDSFGKPSRKDVAWNVAKSITALAHAKQNLKTALVEFEKEFGAPYEEYITWSPARRKAERERA